jgi:excinuclease ABC subunit C
MHSGQASKTMPRDTLKKRLAKFPKSPGVYIMLDSAKEEIYVGKAARLRDRVRQYFQDPKGLDEKTRALVSVVRDVTYIETASEVEALILEAQMIKDLQPRYNVRLKSNEQFALVEIPWKEDFPRPAITREKGHAGSKYYGPFVDVSSLRIAFRILRRAFPYRTCSRTIREKDGKRRYTRPCLNYHIRLCTAPCAGYITRREYRADLERLGLFLRGKKDQILATLRSSMAAASSKQAFEEAARFRDEIAAIESLDRRGSLSDGIEPAPPAIDPREATVKLGEILGCEGPARTIEGIDLSNLGGGDAVGAVVTFADGYPSKGGYRRFRIRTSDTRDDYAMMQEIVRRRYDRLVREHAPVPDVILLDGGLGHIRAAEKVLAKLGLSGPILAGISKARDEEEGSPGRRKRQANRSAGAPDTVRTIPAPEGVEFPRGSPAFRLLQFVRDEAHRFAQHYHHIRRRKRVLGEDDS